MILNIDKSHDICYTMGMKNIYKTERSVIFANDFCDWKTGELQSPVQTQNYSIVQVAECYHNNVFCIQGHLQHCDLEITFPTTNGLSCATNGKQEKLLNHEAYLSFKGDIHALSSRYGCRFQTIAVNFTGTENRTILTALKKRFFNDRKRYAPDLSHFITAIIGEFVSAERTFFLQNLDSLITAVCVHLARTKETTALALSAKMTPSDILQYLDQHFLDICSLNELSVHFGYTYAHICKSLKNEYGITPVEFLLTKKMEYAALLLSQGTRLAEIADVTGYSTPYNFSRAFKKHFGVSPNEFKKQQAQENSISPRKDAP